MSVGPKVNWDISSAELIDRLWASPFGQMMLDREHSAIGEQYGVRRIYRVRKIEEELPIPDKDLNILEIVRRALVRTHDILGFTHTMDGEKVQLLDGGEIVNNFTYSQVTILLESDIHPHYLQDWEWPDLGEELRTVANY